MAGSHGKARRTLRQRTRMFFTKPVTKGARTTKRTVTPSFWKDRR